MNKDCDICYGSDSIRVFVGNPPEESVIPCPVCNGKARGKEERMIEGQIYEYNPTPGKRGVEGTYVLEGKILTVDLKGSDYWRDYLSCIFPGPRKRGAYFKYHRYFYNEAVRLHEHIKKVIDTIPMPLRFSVKIKMRGFSMGGAVAKTYYQLFPVGIVCIANNAPKVSNRRLKQDSYRLYAHRSDMVHRFPFHYRKEDNVQYYGKRGVKWGVAHNTRVVLDN